MQKVVCRGWAGQVVIHGATGVVRVRALEDQDCGRGPSVDPRDPKTEAVAEHRAHRLELPNRVAASPTPVGEPPWLVLPLCPSVQRALEKFVEDWHQLPRGVPLHDHADPLRLADPTAGRGREAFARDVREAAAQVQDMGPTGYASGSVGPGRRPQGRA